MNIHIISGHLGQDSATRVIEGTIYTLLHVAVTINKETTQWYDVMRRDPESKLLHLKKGEKVTVSGRLVASAYVDKRGQAALSLTIWANDIDSHKKREKQQGTQNDLPG
jgi:single-stranded DNA-binding protein